MTFRQDTDLCPRFCRIQRVKVLLRFSISPLVIPRLAQGLVGIEDSIPPKEFGQINFHFFSSFFLQPVFFLWEAAAPPSSLVLRISATALYAHVGSGRTLLVQGHAPLEEFQVSLSFYEELSFPDSFALLWCFSAPVSDLRERLCGRMLSDSVEKLRVSSASQWMLQGVPPSCL